MEVVKRAASRFIKWEYAWLTLIVIATLVLHFMVIARPAEPLFDEQHYVPDARRILTEQTTQRAEHPPLSKELIAGGMLVFGDNQYGWRIPSVLFGTAGLVFFYLMCREFDVSRRGASLGTLVLGFEDLYFVQSGIAMLDIFVVAFMLLAFWLYARRAYVASGIGVALSALSKFTGVFTVFVTGLHWVVKRRDRPVAFVGSLLTAFVSFFALYLAFDTAIYHRVVNVISEFARALSATDSLTFVTAKHPSMSRPWEWIFNLEIMPYWYGPHYIALISFGVWALIVPTLVYLGWRAYKGSSGGLFGLAWVAGTWLVWVPLSLITDRISFIFYFLPTVPAICFGLGMGLDELIGYFSTGRLASFRRTKRTQAMQLLPQPAAAGVDLGDATDPTIPAFEASSIVPTETKNEHPPLSDAVPPPIGLSEPARRRRGFLQWGAISFVIVFFLVHFATFVIVAPPLNNWHIENWFR